MTTPMYDEDNDLAIQRYLADVSRHALLTKDEECQLAARIQAGDLTARNRLVEGCLRLVVKLAKEYHCTGLTLLDLVQEGNLGLLHAARKFDPARGRFTTYATWWIKQAIGRAINERSTLIHIPTHKWTEIYRVERARAALAKLGVQEPTTAQLAEATGMSERCIALLERQTGVPVSLDTPIDDERVLGDLVLGERPDDLEEAETAADLDAEVARLLARLSERERAIVRLRYGLVDDRMPHSLEECAQALGHECDSSVPVTRERIRQIEKKAFKKLRKAVAYDLYHA